MTRRLVTLATISLLTLLTSACNNKNDYTHDRHLPMSCERQQAMLEAGYEISEDDDGYLTAHSYNGDSYRLSSEEAEYGEMFDYCSDYYGGYSGGYNKRGKVKQKKRSYLDSRDRRHRERDQSVE